MEQLIKHLQFTDSCNYDYVNSDRVTCVVLFWGSHDAAISALVPGLRVLTLLP